MSTTGGLRSTVLASPYRQRIVAELADGPKTPSEIAAEETVDVALHDISRGLTVLRNAGAVELLVEESRSKGRLYGLTDRGDEVVAWLRDNGRLNGSARTAEATNSDTVPDAVGDVLSSSYRQHTLAALGDGAKLPTELVEHTPDVLNQSHISRSLNELRDLDLVELLVPEATSKGRLYGLTDDGETTVAWLRDTGRLNGGSP